MRVQLAQQVQELVGTSALVIITERVDDVALLIGHMVKMGFVEVLDRHIPRHWQQRELMATYDAPPAPGAGSSANSAGAGRP